MRRPTFDGVIEAVRYRPDGRIDFVRLYERKGQIFSDRLLVDRKMLAERLKSGRRLVTGRRIPYLAATFDTGRPVRLLDRNGKPVITTWDQAAGGDHLEDVPIL
jgi:hypothetical protein